MLIRVVGCYVNEVTGDFQEPAGWAIAALNKFDLQTWLSQRSNILPFGWLPYDNGVAVVRYSDRGLAECVAKNVDIIASHIIRTCGAVDWCWQLLNDVRYAEWLKHQQLTTPNTSENTTIVGTTRKKVRAPQFECDWQQLSEDGSLLLKNAPIVDGDELMKAIRDASKGTGGVM